MKNTNKILLSFSFMNMDMKILGKILANQTNKTIITYDQKKIFPKGM